MSKRNPFTKRAWDLRHRGGCTDPFLCSENLEKLWEYQNGVCALTGLPIELKATGLSLAHIDHCHKTGLIRGFITAAANSKYLAGLEYLEERSILPFATDHVREYLNNPPAQAFFKTL
jgi:hypothetical protein